MMTEEQFFEQVSLCSAFKIEKDQGRGQCCHFIIYTSRSCTHWWEIYSFLPKLNEWENDSFCFTESGENSSDDYFDYASSGYF